MDQSEAPILDGLVDYRRNNRYGYAPPGHRQGRGVDDRVLAVLGHEPFVNDVLVVAVSTTAACATSTSNAPRI